MVCRAGSELAARRVLLERDPVPPQLGGAPAAGPKAVKRWGARRRRDAEGNRGFCAQRPSCCGQQQGRRGVRGGVSRNDWRLPWLPYSGRKTLPAAPHPRSARIEDDRLHAGTTPLVSAYFVGGACRTHNGKDHIALRLFRAQIGIFRCTLVFLYTNSHPTERSNLCAEKT